MNAMDTIREHLAHLERGGRHSVGRVVGHNPGPHVEAIRDALKKLEARDALFNAIQAENTQLRVLHNEAEVGRFKAEAQVAALTQERDRVHRALDAAGIGEGTAASRVGKLRGDKEAAEAALATTRQALERIADPHAEWNLVKKYDGSALLPYEIARRALAATNESEVNDG